MIEATYSVSGAARRVNRDRRTIQRWLDNGLTHQRVGQQVTIREADLTAWLRQAITNERTNQFRPSA